MQEHSLYNRSDCTNCHNVHGGQQYLCGDCHGLPPTQNAQGPLGYAYDPTTGYNYNGYVYAKDESRTPHGVHSAGLYNYVCDQCHKGNFHDTNTYPDVYNGKTGILAAHRRLRSRL